MAGYQPSPRQCGRCDTRHDLAKPHPLPPGLLPVGKFTWHRIIRLFELPDDWTLRAVIHEVEFEAAEDGTDIWPGNPSLAGWAGAGERSVTRAIAWLRSRGLLWLAFDARSPGRGGGKGRAAVYELTARQEYVTALKAGGYELELTEGVRRKFWHAAKPDNDAPPVAGHSAINEVPPLAVHSVNDPPRNLNDPPPVATPQGFNPKEVNPKEVQDLSLTSLAQPLAPLADRKSDVQTRRDVHLLDLSALYETRRDGEDRTELTPRARRLRNEVGVRVGCRSCAAPPGRTCVTPGGKVYPKVHDCRITDAVRSTAAG